MLQKTVGRSQLRVEIHRLVLGNGLEPWLVVVLDERAQTDPSTLIRTLRCDNNIGKGGHVTRRRGESGTELEIGRVVEDRVQKL